MKLTNLCALAPLLPAINAFVILSEETAQQVFQVEGAKPDRLNAKITKSDPFYYDAASIEQEAESHHGYASAWAEAVDAVPFAQKSISMWDTVMEQVDVINEETEEFLDTVFLDEGGDDDKNPPEPPEKGNPKPPHDKPHPPGKNPHGPPEHGPPHHPHPPHPPHRGHPPHCHHPHDFTDSTIYENIGKSNFTKKAFALINEDKDLVKFLNSTKANITFFVPVDAAFERIPKHGKKPSKEFIRALLAYHASGSFYPAREVFLSHTIETELDAPDLGAKDVKQRIRVGFGPRGWDLAALTLNFYSKVVTPDVFSSNGVVHGIDHILIPPPPARKILEILPGQFSTLVNGLYKTGLIKELDNITEGVTLFAPSNEDFKWLGPRVLAYLFSKFGEKHLTALLKYHIVKGTVLYSDGLVQPEGDIPKGVYHVDLKTLLDKNLSIDIARWGRLIEVKINSFSRVVVQDGIAKDGVIHVPNRVLIPPKDLNSAGSEIDGEMTVEEIKARLDPYVEA